MHEKRERHCSKKDGIPILGFGLIAIGSVFLFDKLGLIDDYWRSIIISWKSLLIFLGIINLFKHNSRLPGIVLIIIGSAFMLPELVDISFEIKQLIWPVVLILIGVAIVGKARNFKKREFKTQLGSTDTDDRLEEVAIFGGGKRVVTNKNLKGGSITAIFGGLEIDLSEADLHDDVTYLEVTAILGGVSLMVKPEWDVQVQVNTILGGFSDERRIYKSDSNTTTAKKLIIKGSAIFGGGEVKSY